MGEKEVGIRCAHHRRLEAGVLTEIGLGTDAACAYRALLKEPRAETGALAARLGWSVDRASNALDELFGLSLVRPSHEHRDSRRLVDPELGLQALIDAQERELLRRQQILTQTKLAAENLVDEYRSASESGPVSSVRELRGIDAVQTCVEKTCHECREEIQVFVPGGAQPGDVLASSQPLDLLLLERSARVSYVYQDSIRNDRPTSEYAQWLVEQGAEVRTVPHLPLRVIIWDRRTALVPIDPAAPDTGAFLLSSPGPVAALQSLFEQVWQRAARFGEERDRERDGALADQESAVLGLLAAGLTDEVIARKLGVSVRTSRRVTAALMNRLGARSRFQLGALAAERGWLVG
ncbi:LuxR C-terminal-related transcriptional regulator [Streptomyces cyaneofuscatus]|uniref:LuxR C-terminal-related transcriptional regulator n=1 Tax=Streptomyces cyaneofuscatus TaxID=66883 RepID=UPI003657B02A